MGSSGGRGVRQLTSLTTPWQIFVESNNGAEYTAISGLHFFGVPVQGTDLNKIKK
jgi:hypothetical protein